MLIMCENQKPLYAHTVDPSETIYLGSINGKDYYYRYNGDFDVIDVRYSDIPHDYVNWSLDTFHNHIYALDEIEARETLSIVKKAIELKYKRLYVFNK